MHADPHDAIRAIHQMVCDPDNVSRVLSALEATPLEQAAYFAGDAALTAAWEAFLSGDIPMTWWRA